MQADPEHAFEIDWSVYEQAIPEPPSSLIIGEAFTGYPVKTENDSCYLIDTTNDTSSQMDKDDFTLTSSSLNPQRQLYSIQQNRVSRFSTESNSDQISDDEDFLLNNGANTDNSDTRKLKDGNETSNFYSDRVQNGFLVSSRGNTKARQCDECKIWLKSSGTLYRHKVKFHRDPVKRPICNKILSRINNMKRHVWDQH